MDNLKNLKDRISYEDVYLLLEDLGAEPRDFGNHIEALTICHDGDSHKLYYYRDSQGFICYTHDGNFDIIGLMQKVKSINFGEAVQWLKNRFGFLNPVFGTFNQTNETQKEEDLNPLNSIKNKNIEYQALKKYNDAILNDFYKIPHISWIKENISSNSMNKYEISYNLDNNQIVIPHRDKNNELVGIRVRNLNKSALDRGLKYSPIWHKGIEYKYPTGMNLYGLNNNKDIIKSSKQIILFEAEKSVIKMDSMYGCANAVALNGTMLSDYQIKLIDELNVDEVIIAVDKDFHDIHSEEAKKYAKKIYSIFKKLKNRYTVSIIWDRENLLEYKMSPVDKDKTTFEKLMNRRIYL